MKDFVEVHQTVHISSYSPNDLLFDHDKYPGDLADLDISKDQKRELLETLWSIMRLFVEFGYSVDVSGQAAVEIFNRAARGDESCGGYAGYVEAPNWDVSRRLGQHEALISYETFERIQNRLEGIGRALHRKNLNEDFSLRGFVECADCGTPLTSCWSKGSHARYPYYLCPKRGYDSYGKSIRRE